jgi:uncharacterized cupredoxin-like copper-binding protein
VRVLAAVPLGLLALGCGGGEAPATGARVVAVTLTGGAIAVSPATVAAGALEFQVANADGAPHDLVVLRTYFPAAELPTDEAGEVDESELEVVDEIEWVAAGAAGTLRLRLEPGHYALICNLPGSYGNRMYADFEVTP